MINKNEFFKRQIALWGEEIQSNLYNKKILIVGCGGLGSSVAIALGASGIGEISLVDFDDVSLHNIHRQIAFKIDDENKNKSKVLRELLESRFDGVCVKNYNINFIDFIKTCNTKFDLILDCTDNLPIRKEISIFASESKTPWIYASVEEFHGQICFFENAKFESLFMINDRKPAGIACPIVMQIASFEANMALRFLAGLPISKDKLYYLFFDKFGDFNIQKFSLQTD